MEIWADRRPEPPTDAAARYCAEKPDLDEVKRWLIGFRSESEVLMPRELREDLAGEGGEIGEVYAHLPGTLPQAPGRRRSS